MPIAVSTFPNFVSEPPSGHARTRALAVFLGAAVVGSALTFWNWMVGPDGGGEQIVFHEMPTAEATLPPDPTLAAHAAVSEGPAAPARDATPVAPAATSVAVRIVDEAGVPIPGAIARTVAGQDWTRSMSLVLTREVIGEALAGPDGHLELGLPPGARAGETRILASADAYRGAMIPWPESSPGAEIPIVLARGEDLGGVVVGRDDKAAAGLHLAARSLALPLGLQDRAVPGSEHDCRAATTDSEGRFLFRGLARGSYEIQIASDGWCLHRPREFRDRQQVEVVSGRTDLRVVADQVRWTRVRFVNARSKAPISQTQAGSTVLRLAPTEGVAGLELQRLNPVFDASDRLPSQEQRTDPTSLFLGWIWGSTAAMPSRVKLLFRIEGYQPGSVDLALLSRGELQRSRTVTEVLLEPAEDTGSVRVIELLPEPGFPTRGDAEMK